MNNLKKFLPIFILVILSFVPIFIWIFMEPIKSRFSDFSVSMTSLGQITGILGMILFALNLTISNRSVFFDKLFFGLNRFYGVHKWLGSLSFSLLLFHPIFLAIKFLSISLYDAAMFFLPVGNFAVAIGIIALLGMIVLLFVTLFIKIKYHIWKFSHKFMVLVFIVAMGHVMFISSDISENLFLRSYILFFSFLGLFSGFYRAFIHPLLNNNLKFIVKKISLLSDNVFDIELEPIDKKMNFISGQYIFIKFIGNGIGRESHPFSITSSPLDENLKITIKALGDFTSELGKITRGTKASIEGPYGNFFGERKGKKEIWLAGGVGITPFLSIARSLKGDMNDIFLFYCLNEEKEAVLLEELKNISKKNPKFHLIEWYSKEKGRINAEIIENLLGNIKTMDVFLCGPLPFMRALESQLINKGVEKSNIYFEEFNFI